MLSLQAFSVQRSHLNGEIFMRMLGEVGLLPY